MPSELNLSHRLRFGVFEVNLPARELRKHGIRMKLRGQPFEILAILLEKSGEIVTREEMKQKLWPVDTFVDFEHSLNSAIKKLRQVLGDSPESPRYIETVPRFGYRFIAPVSRAEPVLASATITATPSLSIRPWLGWGVGLLVISIAVSGMAWLIHARTSRAFGEKDSILLADFENSTGEYVFDGALKEALVVQLGQSPFLNIISEDRVRETLRFMGRSPEDRVLLPVAREVCERVSAKAVLWGSIARLGSHYVIAVHAVNCLSGSSLARDQIEAESKEQVLRALAQAARKLRGELGESLSSIQRFDVPIAQATTESLEALKAYSLGIEGRARGAEFDSIPLFKRAVELDPQFAMAYAQMAAAFNNLGESDRASDYLKKAFALREHISEREKLYLTARYYTIVTGEIDKATETYELWSRIYARDWVPYNGLAARYQIIGQFEKAAEAAREALRLEPNHFLPYANLASSYRSLSRFEEAKDVCEKAVTAGRDSSYTHITLFEIAFLRGDRAAMQRELDWAQGTPRENDLLTAQALVEVSSGKLRVARQLFKRAQESAQSRGLGENAAFATAWEALAEADLGNHRQARARASAAVRIGHTIDPQETAAEALALSGDIRQARALADDLIKRFPHHTPLNGVSLPTILGTIELRRGNPARAIELLQGATPYDLSEFSNLAAVYVRGQAYLRRRSGKEATLEFQKIVDHSGIAPTSPRHALAHLGLARAYSLLGDMAKSRRAYDEFFVLWKDADPDIPILREAHAEYAGLDKQALQRGGLR